MLKTNVYLNLLLATSKYILNICTENHTFVNNYFMFMKINSMASPFPENFIERN